MAYEKFEQSYRRTKEHLKGSLDKEGRLIIRKNATKYLKDYKYAVLYYDRDLSKIGVELFHLNQKHSRSITGRINGTSRWLNIEQFLKYFNIPYPIKRNVNLVWTKENFFEVLIPNGHKQVNEETEKTETQGNLFPDETW